MVKVLVVCANGDSQDNLDSTKYIVDQLSISDNTIEFTSVNIDDIKPSKTQLYDKHIIYKFGSDDTYTSEFKEEKYDIIIFQGCMTCLPNSFNIFNEPYTFDTIIYILDNNGMFINVDDCYYKGDVQDGAKVELSKNFVISKKIPRKFGRRMYDVWVRRKKNQFGMFLTYRSLDGF